MPRPIALVVPARPTAPPEVPPAGPTPDQLDARLRSTFGAAYLTLTGVTQSVTLAVLAARVEASFPAFGLADWLTVATTFLLVILVWNEYFMASIAYYWTPTLADALFPFGLLACELAVAHTATSDQRAWLASVGALLVVGTGAFGWGFAQARRRPADNGAVLAALGVHQPLTMAVTGVAAAVALTAAALHDVADLDRLRLAVSAAALVLALAVVLRSVPYWRRVTRYASR